MEIKYLSDDKGKITGVFISIEEWERLQKEYKIAEKVPAVFCGVQGQPFHC